MFNKVPAKKLKIDVNKEEFLEDDTSKIKPKEGKDRIVCQEKALEEILDGLEDSSVNSNILIIGPTGVGKSIASSTLVEEWCRSQTPENLTDKIFLYNFENPKNPLYVSLPAGKGRELKDDLENFVEAMKKNVTELYDSKANQITDEQARIKEEGEKKHSEVFKKYFPEHADLNLRSPKAHEVAAKNPQAILELNKIVLETNVKIAKSVNENTDEIKKEIVKNEIEKLREKYENEKLAKFFDLAEEDILKNFKIFDMKKDADPMSGLINLPNFGPDKNEYILKKYLGNLQVDHSETKHIPFGLVENTSFEGLVGRIKIGNPNIPEPEHFKVQVGDFTKYDKGILLFDEGSTFLLSNMAILKFLTISENKKLKIGEGGMSGLYGSEGIETESIDADFKVVMNLDNKLARILMHRYPQFTSRFNYKAYFEGLIENTKENRQQLFNYVANEVNELNKTSAKNGKKEVPHFSKDAVISVIEHMAREHNQKYLMFDLRKVKRLVKKSANNACKNNSDLTRRLDVANVLKKDEDSLYRRYMTDEFKDDKIQIDLKGSKVGQINGLAYAGEIGYPMQTIVITDKLPEKGINIFNLEGEKLSGPTWNKGIMLADAYLTELFKRYGKGDIGVNIAVTSPENWYGIDGPSASAAITYAILSSMSEIPINQGICVTGALKPNGDITAVGGLNEKIEGAYYISKNKLGKLNGEQGVLIPYVNIIDCNLKDEVLEDIEKGRFNVYYHKNIDDGLRLLMGKTKEEILERAFRNYWITKRKPKKRK